jgi:hypothetical protein
MATSRINISNKFETGDIPSQSDFGEIFDSFVHKDEDKADFQMVEAGTDNEHYVTPALLRTGLQNIGIITGNCYMPHKENFEDSFSGTILPLTYFPIPNSVKVFKNGQLLQEGPDYTVNYDTAQIKFLDPVSDRNLEVDYWYKNLAPTPGGGGNAIDFTNFLHTTGNETKKGILTFNNTTPTSTNGILLTNSGATATALDVTVSGAGNGISMQNSSTGIGVKLSNSGAGVAVNVNSTTGSTGDILQVAKNNVLQTKIDSEGNITAPKYVTTGGTASQFVKGDGTLDPTAYANNNFVIHTTGNESKDGALTLTHDASPPQDVLTIVKNNSANCLKLVQNSSSNATTSTFDTTTANNNRKAISIQKEQQEKAFITHDGNVTGTSFTTLNEKADITDGFLTLAGSSSPAATTGHAKLYAKTDSTTDMYVMGSDGVEKKIGGVVDLSTYSKLASPTFTGVPTAPTATAGTNTTQIATTEFVLANSGGTPDATTAVKGKIKLAGDLGGTADLPTTPTSVHLTGNEVITGMKTIVSTPSVLGAIQISNSNNFSPLSINQSGNGVAAINILTQLGSSNSLLINTTTTGTGLAIVSQNNGVNAFTVTKAGEVTATSFIKAGGTSAQFLKADGSVDSNTYLTSGNAVLTTGNQNVDGVKTFTNSGSTQVSGINLNNDGTYINGVLQVKNSVNGTGVGIFNNGSGSGIYVNNSSTGSGIFNNQTGSGYSAYYQNQGTGIATFTSNQSTGVGASITNMGSGTAQLITNFSGSTGSALVINAVASASGLSIKSQSNGTDTFTVNKTGDVKANSFVKAGGLSTEYLKADGSVSTAPDSRPYKVYTALISFNGTSAPTATVLENTLGGTVVWTRWGVGGYSATLSGAFTSNKTTVLSSYTLLGINFSGYSDTVNTVNFGSTNMANNAYLDTTSGSSKATVEIRVYN